MRSLFWLLVVAGACFAPAAQAEDPGAFDTLFLRGSVTMLRSDTPVGNPSTIVSIGDDGVLIVDPNLDLVGDALLPAIAKLGGRTIRFVTATHFHGDHTENLEMLSRRAPMAVAVVPHGLRRQLATGEVVHGERPLMPEALPVLTFEKQITLYLNGDVIEVSTLPNRRGHTDSDAVVYFRRANVLCVGDYLFLERYPIVDASGDLEGYLANMEFLIETYPADAIVVPGHGRFRPDSLEASSMQQLRTQHAMLTESVAWIRQRLASGLSVDDLVDAGLPAKFQRYGEKPRYVSEEGWIRFVAARALPEPPGR